MKRKHAAWWGGVWAFAMLAAVSAHADEKAEALLKEVENASKSAKTLTATVTTTMTAQGQNIQSTGTVRLKQPNFARIEMTKPQAQTIASDGKNLFLLMPGNQYMKMPLQEGVLSGVVSSAGMPAGLFLDIKSVRTMGGSLKLEPRYAGPQTIGQTKYEVVDLKVAEAGADITIKLFINPDKLVTRTEMALKQQEQTFKQISELSSIKTGQPLTDASFAYAPPKNAKLYEQPNYESKLVPVGKPAPVFSLPAPTGETVSLYDATKGKKAVLVNFWFYG